MATAEDKAEIDEYEQKQKKPIGNLCDEDGPYLEGENYARLCYHFYYGAPLVMSYIFNQIHPPGQLVERLAQSNIHKTLRRLKVIGLITPEKWKILYPRNKSLVSSKKFDAVLTHLLLQNICHMSAPYPNGWDELPEDSDRSLSAETVRLNYYLTTLVHLSREIDEKEYKLHLKYMNGILEKIAPSHILEKLEDPNTIKLPQRNTQEKYINYLKGWYAEAVEIRAKEKKVQDVLELRESTDHDLNKLNKNRLPTRESEADSQLSLMRKQAMIPNSSSSTSSVTSDPSVSSATKTVNVKALEKEIVKKFQKRLTESIAAEDVVGNLLQKGLLNHEEKNRIQLQTTNPNRMKMILDIIMRKQGKFNPFDSFCDIIKFKYKGIYDILQEARNAPFLLDKKDEGTECSKALAEKYNEMLSNLQPIPWNHNVKMPIHQFYQQVFLTDANGKNLQLTELFTNYKKHHKRHKFVLIEGEGGVGKTTMIKQFLYDWAHQKHEQLREKIKLAFYVDLKMAANGDLCETLVKQCLPFTYKKSADELYNIIKANQKRTLFILDGYEYIRGIDDEFLDLIHKNIFKDCYLVVLTRNQYVTSKLSKLFDTTLAVLGIENEGIKNTIENYTEFTDTSTELYENLLMRVNTAEPNLTKTFASNPLLCQCLCLISQHQKNISFKTVTNLLQEFLSALKAHFCSEHNLKHQKDGSIPESVEALVLIFEEIAFENLLENRVVLDMEAIIRKHMDEDIRHFGLLDLYMKNSNNHPEEHGLFVNVVFQEFLAAQFLSSIEEEDFPRYITLLTTEKHLFHMTKLYIGLQQQATTTTDIFEELNKLNREIWNGSNTFNNNFEFDENGVKKLKDVDQVEGKLEDFEFSLQCVAECPGRKDLIQLVAESLPNKIYTKSKHLFTGAAITGLGYVLKQNHPTTVELDIRLNNLGQFLIYPMNTLAKGIENSIHITVLRLRWNNDSLLARFLATIFGQNESISVLKIYDESKSTTDDISATTWSHLSSARKGMKEVQVLSFTSCHNPALVSSLIRNVPENLEELYLDNCSVNMIAADEIARKMEKIYSLRYISLNGIHFRKPDFIHITNGIRHTKSLRELILSNTNLDVHSTQALAEALKFNKTLRRLDIAGAAFNAEGCRILGLALALNKTLLEVNMKSVQITRDELDDIKRMKREGITITGTELEE